MQIETFEQLVNVGALQTVFGFKSPPTQSPKPLGTISKMIIYPTLTDNYAIPTVYDRVLIHGVEAKMNFDDKTPTQFTMFVQPPRELNKYKKRGEDIGALIKRTYADTQRIIVGTLTASTRNIDPDLRFTVKNLLENYKSLLDYTAHYIADNCDPVPPSKQVYFPVASSNVNREAFIKSLDRSFPKLQSRNPALFEYLLQIQYFNNDDCLLELNQLTNSFKHHGLADFEHHPYESHLIKCGAVGFRVGELGYDFVDLDATGRLILRDATATAIISGPRNINISTSDALRNFDGISIEKEQRILLKSAFSNKSVTGLLWSFSTNIIRIVNECCRRHRN